MAILFKFLFVSGFLAGMCDLVPETSDAHRDPREARNVGDGETLTDHATDVVVTDIQATVHEIKDFLTSNFSLRLQIPRLLISPGLQASPRNASGKYPDVSSGFRAVSAKGTHLMVLSNAGYPYSFNATSASWTQEPLPRYKDESHVIQLLAATSSQGEYWCTWYSDDSLSFMDPIHGREPSVVTRTILVDSYTIHYTVIVDRIGTNGKCLLRFSDGSSRFSEDGNGVTKISVDCKSMQSVAIGALGEQWIVQDHHALRHDGSGYAREDLQEVELLFQKIVVQDKHRIAGLTTDLQVVLYNSQTKRWTTVVNHALDVAIGHDALYFIDGLGNLYGIALAV